MVNMFCVWMPSSVACMALCLQAWGIRGNMKRTACTNKYLPTTTRKGRAPWAVVRPPHLEQIRRKCGRLCIATRLHQVVQVGVSNAVKRLGVDLPTQLLTNTLHVWCMVHM